METKAIVRYGWLKAMYIWTILGAGGFGVGLLFLPDMMRTIFGYPSQDPLLFGISGSIYVAFGLVAILGFISPVKFAPVLLLQLCYKLIWFIVVLLPSFIAGFVPGYGWIFAGIFATYVIGDLIAIPFPIVFERETK
jgi:hypothetical protein